MLGEWMREKDELTLSVGLKNCGDSDMDLD